MVKIGKTTRADRAQAVKYLAVGRALHETAKDLAGLSEAKYGNGLAIVAIHAAIAYTDALTIAYREIKSTDGDHTRAADVLVQALGHRADDAQIKRLRSILNAKSHASYSGNYYTITDAIGILERTNEFVAWAKGLYDERPA
jgi:hypothetical protein